MEPASRTPRIIHIVGNLWLGDLRATVDRNILGERRIERIFSVLHPPYVDPVIELTASSNLHHLVFPIRDEQPFPEEMDVAVRHAMSWVKTGLTENTGTIIHCFAGISRSSSAVVTHLVLDGMPVADALALLKERHPLASPHPLVLGSFLRAIGKELPPDYHVWIAEQWEKLKENRRSYPE